MNELLREVSQFALQVWRFEVIAVDKSPITVGALIIGVTLIVVGFGISRRLSRRIASRISSQFTLERSVAHTFEQLSFYVLVTMTTLFALKMANVPLTVFSVIGGALAIGVGFGSQNVVKNFISGLILMIERPVKVGDFVEIETEFAQVIHIGLRSSIVRTFGNRNVIIPNSTFLETNVLNWTLSDRYIRARITVGVAYGSNTELVRETLMESANSHSRVIRQEKTSVLFSDFGDNALIFDLFFWIDLTDLEDFRVIASDIRFQIDRLSRERDIVIAFPQRDVHLHSPNPIQIETISPSSA